MDGISKAIVAQLSEGLAQGDASLQTSIGNCLRSRCQKVVGQCRGSSGPCPTKEMRLQAIRSCRAIKRELMDGDAMVATCERKINKMQKGATVKGGYTAGAPEDLDVLMNRCLHTDAGRHPAYEQCFNDTWRDATLACAAANCGASVSACLERTCGIATTTAAEDQTS